MKKKVKDYSEYDLILENKKFLKIGEDRSFKRILIVGPIGIGKTILIDDVINKIKETEKIKKRDKRKKECNFSSEVFDSFEDIVEKIKGYPSFKKDLYK